MKKKILFLLIAAFSVGISLNAQNMKNEVPTISAFPTGNENVGFQQHFTGKSWLAPLTSNKDLNVPVYNVTFEPGCRNSWHSHTGGQILVEHWHGAAPDSWFSHLAVECNPQNNKNTWLNPVSDEEYAATTKKNQ